MKEKAKIERITVHSIAVSWFIMVLPITLKCIFDVM